MRIVVFYLTLFIVANSCTVNRANRKALNQIHEHQVEFLNSEENNPSILDRINVIRKEVVLKNDSEIRLSDYDVIYMLEAYSSETGQVIGKMWNDEMEIRFKKDVSNKVEVLNDTASLNRGLSLFFNYETKYMRSLIEKWDIESIKMISDSSQVLGGLNYIATRIENYKGEMNISTISFYDFPFKYKRK
jgi:hypothetical protein